ncbi:MAG: glycosyltransferase [Actinomycetota bacterium]|nr:glycosyltransferase [Actinomycetota bacterium]
MTPRVSIVIRTKDEAEHLGGVLDSLERQTVRAPEAETILVDSGSTDDTVAIARRHGARIIEIAPEEFTFGRALNIGSEAAAAPVIVALSGHAYPPDDAWLERMLGWFEDERVACATGAGNTPAGEPLTEPILQDEALVRRHPYWGFSNAAGGYRTDLWRERPFREDMPGTEDKEWAWHWLTRGRLVAIDPTLATDHDHTRDHPLDTYRRARREWRGFRMYLDVPPLTVRELLDRQRTNDDWKLRIHPSVWASLAGEYVERRRR